MSQKPISELRRHMLEDMAVRRLGEKTKSNYIHHIANFTAFFGRSPDTATAEDVRRFQVHLTEIGVGASSINQAATALRFFFGTTLDRPELARHLARVHYPRPLPRVLSPEEVGRLLEAAPGPGLKYKAALSIAYGAGLRAGEVVMGPSHTTWHTGRVPRVRPHEASILLAASNHSGPSDGLVSAWRLL